jgi:class 3 adenylate cyclase/tetratricopeptide (TPR) repeat protein
MPACPKCGQQNPELFKFCSECGSALALETAPGREVRKTVTVVFSDVTGSTALGERVDPESLRRVMTRYFDEMRTVLERHGGTVEKFIGDAVMAVFGIPHVHEDDALRAVRATIEMREQLAELNHDLEREFGLSLEVRMGVASGEVIAGDPAGGEAFVTGDTVNVTERLQGSAAPGEILISEETCGLVRDAVEVEPVGPLTVKGKTTRLHAYRLLGVMPGAPAHARRSGSPMVGRARELELLMHAHERAVSERACILFTVLGTAGVGKSRLVAELLKEVGSDATVLIGRCPSYGEGITFWPAVEVIKLATGIDEGDSSEEIQKKIVSVFGRDEAADLAATRIAGLLGPEGTTTSAEEGFWGIRKLFEALARRKPLIVGFDDLNWAEPTFLDLVEHVAEWSRDVPILIVCMARPELLELRPGWGGGKRNATTIFLEPLSKQDCGALIHNLLDQAASESSIQVRIRDASEGNPLFVEETLSMLIDDGLLVRDNGHWVATGDLSRVQVPPTIQLLLASRLDQLSQEERRAIECAAVEGDVFHRSSVEALTPRAARTRVAACLQALERKELIRPHRASRPGEEAFRFRHLLIQEAAYRAVPKEILAELHVGFAQWLEQRGGELEELIGFHLERAVQHRLDLAPLDERGRALASRAGELLAAAGRRSIARGDSPAAVGLLERAAALLTDTPRRAEVLIDLGRSLLETGSFTRAETVLREGSEEAEARGDKALAARALLELSLVRSSVEQHRSITEYLHDAQSAIAPLEEARDDAGLARAWFVVGEMWWLRCEFAATETAMTRAVVHAEQVGSKRELSRARTYLALAAVDGPTPVETALGRCRDILEEAADDKVLEAAVGYAMAFGEAMRGRFDEARELAGRSSAIYEEFGRRFALAAWSSWPGAVELLAGEPEAAERIFRSGFETLSSLGEKLNLSTIAASLAESLYLQGRDEEAEHLTVVSEEATSPDDVWAQVTWRSARARVLARRGELRQAESLARKAVALISETDALNMRAHALSSLAEILAASGRREEAAKSTAEALRLYEAKGNVVSASKARATLSAGVRAGAT